MTDKMITIEQYHGKDAVYYGKRGNSLVAYSITRDTEVVDKFLIINFIKLPGDKNEKE